MDAGQTELIILQHLIWAYNVCANTSGIYGISTWIFLHCFFAVSDTFFGEDFLIKFYH